MALPKVSRSQILQVTQGNPNQQQSPQSSAGVKTKSDTQILMEILRIHKEAKKSLVLWGSSGFGKSATIKEFAKAEGMKLIDIKAISLDPLTTAMPEVQNGVVNFVPNTWFHEVCTSDEPIVLFLDEINKFSNPSVQNMLNDLILDRQYVGHKIKPNVFIVGAANFVSESEEASPLDESILFRLTNILFAPKHQEVCVNMQTRLGKKLATKLKVVGKGVDVFQEEILDKLHKDIPRQIDHIAELCDGVTDRDIIEKIVLGRIGKDGLKIIDDILRESTFVSELTRQTMPKVVAMHNSGAKADVLGLVEDCNDSELACELTLTLKSKTIMSAVLKKWGNDVEYKGNKFLVECANAGLFGG